MDLKLRKTRCKNCGGELVGGSSGGLICPNCQTAAQAPMAAPAAPPAAAPVVAPAAKAPVAVPVVAPAVAPAVKVPVVAPVAKAPVAVPVVAPAAPPAAAPVVKAPVAAPVAAPAVKAPVAAPVAAPVVAPVAKAPVAAPVAAQVVTPAAAAPVITPVADDVAAPVVSAPQFAESRDNEFAIGSELHGYVILRKLGTGGMGTVYLAEQKSMQRNIALKILNPSVTRDTASVDQFLNEIRNTGQIHHPNIVNAFDAGYENGVYYLAMQYISGDTLDHILQKSGAMGEITALEIVNQVSGALAYVWNKYKIFHRDIKPGNIMLDQDEGKAMLMDLGISQKLGEGVCDSESVEGSPFYMSPEQIQGKSLSWSTDLYSLGATLYQLIVGVPPYDDTSIEGILKKHCQAPFPEPSTMNPGCKISPETVELLKTMMAKQPEKRFSSWGDFIRALNEVITTLKDFEENPDKRVTKNAVELAQEKRELIKKKKRNASRITLLVFLILAGAGVFGYKHISQKNAAAAVDFLGGNKKERVSKLDEAFEVFKKDPSKYSEFEIVLKKAEITAKSIGVHPDDSKEILAQSASYKKEAERLKTDYNRFKDFMVAFDKRSKEIIAEQKKLEGINPSEEQCRYIQDLISSLKVHVNAQKPLDHKNRIQLEKYKETLSKFEKDSKKNFDKWRTNKKRKDDELVKRSTVKLADYESDVVYDFSKVDSSVAEEIRKKEDKQRAAERSLAEKKKNEIDALRKQLVQNSNTIQKKAAKKKVVSPFVVQIQKEMISLTKRFEEAAYKFDLKEAYDIKINPDIQKFPQIPEVKAEMAKLQALYDKYHKVIEIAYEPWLELNNLSNMEHFNKMTVRTTVINSPLGKSRLTVEKILNGNVYFSEPGSVPVPFISLHMADKENLASKLIMVKKYRRDVALSFYYVLGLYRLAYDLCPDAKRVQMVNDAKLHVQTIYKEAKKRNDLITLQRLERDYKGLKIMKGIIK